MTHLSRDGIFSRSFHYTFTGESAGEKFCKWSAFGEVNVQSRCPVSFDSRVVLLCYYIIFRDFVMC